MGLTELMICTGFTSRFGRESAAVLLAGVLGGCCQPEIPRGEQLSKGCIFMLPGVESGSWQLGGPIRGLREAGIEQAIRVIPWGDRPFRELSNLVDYPENRRRAARIAEGIAAYEREYPGRPATLIGYSGGAGIAVLAAERLPEGARLDRLILLAAALSPTYDLAPARSRCTGEIVNFYSECDWFMLGLGTHLFGTIDRKRTTAAGRRGFDTAHVPAGVRQIGWTADWMWLGNDGGHVGWFAPAWSREVLARYIPADATGGSDEPTSRHPSARSPSSRSARPS